MRIKNLLSAFAVSAIISYAAFAQVGRIEGDVIKAGGTEPVVGAEVVIERTDIKGSYPVKTDKKGHFLHAGVPYSGTYTLLVSAAGHAPTFLTGIKPTGEALKVELSDGDGRKLTMADVKGASAGGPGGKAPANAAENKKMIEENEKKRAEIDAANKKASADFESMKKFFDSGVVKMGAKDYTGAITDFTEASKLDADQYSVWANLGLAQFNRGVTNFNESLKDPSKRDAAKADFTAAVSSADKAIAISEPKISDPAKGAQAKKETVTAVKIKADSESLLAKRLGVMEMAEAAQKDYAKAAELSETPAEKNSFILKGAETLREAGKNEEAAAAFKNILQGDPQNAEAMYNLGLVYSSEEKTWQDAANMLQKFVDTAKADDPRITEAKSVIDALLQGNKNLTVPKSEKPAARSGGAKKKP